MARKSFEDWMKEVDKELVELCGLTHDVIDDSPYHDWYDQGMRAKTAAKKAFKNAYNG